MIGRNRAIATVLSGGLGLAILGFGVSPLPQVLGLPLVVAALFLGLVPLPRGLSQGHELLSQRPLTSWSVPMVLLAALVFAVYYPLAQGDMPWAVGQADHPTHQYQAWLFVEHLLSSGRLTGWSDFRWAGYPALELYPMGGPLWVGLWRALTLGLLDWEATYALAIVAMITSNVLATYVATRRLSGKTAAIVAALLVLFERGWPRQGGDHYAVDVGVWPVTMGIGPLLLCLERLWAWSSNQATARALAASCVLAGWALICHPMYLPVLMLAMPTVFVVALAKGIRSDRVASAVVLTLLLGFMLAAFWYAPFLAHGKLSEPGGAPFRSLNNLGEGIAMASFLPSFWVPALVAAFFGAALALARGGGMAILTVLAIILILAASSTPLELSSALSNFSASVQQERFLIPLRVILCILAGHGVGFLALQVSASLRPGDWSLRKRLAALGVIFLVTPLAAPAFEGVVKHLVVPVVELESGRDLPHRRDLHALCDWLREQTDASGETVLSPRTVWHVGFGHHEYNNAPIYCGLAQMIETPAETFASRPGGISEREVRAFAVRWVIGDRPIEGRDDYLRLRQRFGALHVYEVLRYAPTRLTMLGEGRARIVHFDDEYIRVRVEDAHEGARLAIHVTRHPAWTAEMNGEEVPVAGGHLGLPRADLIHVPVTDGVLELRFQRGVFYILGALASLIAALAIGFIACFAASAPLRRIALSWKPITTMSKFPPFLRATAICLTGAIVLGSVLYVARRESGRPRPESSENAQGQPLADLLDSAEIWVVAQEANGGSVRHPLKRRWDGRFGQHLPPEILVDRHVEALDLGDPRRVIAVRVAEDEEVHIRFNHVGGIRGLRGFFARGGRGRAATHLSVQQGEASLGSFTHDRLGHWLEFEALRGPGPESPSALDAPLELVVRASGSSGRAVLIDATLVRGH